MIRLLHFLLLSTFIFLTGCESVTPNLLKTTTEETLQARSLQTKTFTTTSEENILAACAGVLQDLGYQLEETQSTLGVMVASKQRETDNKGQQTLAHVATLLGAFSGNLQTNPYENVDKQARIRVCVVTRPDPANKQTFVRVTFQQKVWDMTGRLSKQMTLSNPELYDGFFQKLSKAVFLEAHKI